MNENEAVGYFLKKVVVPLSFVVNVFVEIIGRKQQDFSMLITINIS